jgi:hypothetical protein
MKRRNLLFLPIIALFVSCLPEKEDVLDYEKVSIVLDLDEGLSSNYSEFISEIYYHYIETEAPNLLVTPYKVIANDSLYFIEDSFQKKVIKYKKSDGSYKIFGVSGEGPGENLELDDFSILDDTLVILDSKLKKFLSFHQNTGFIEEIKSTFNRSLFFQGEGFRLIYHHNDPELGYRILRIADNGSVDGFLPIEDWFARKLTRDQNSFILSNIHDRIYFSLPYTNEIAIFSSSGYLEKVVKLDFGKYNFGKEYWEQFGDFSSQIDYATENNLVIGINSFIVLEDKFVVSVNQEGGKKHLIVLDRDFNIISHFNNLLNDIDGVVLSAIPWTGYGNNLIYMINSKRFFQENNFEQISDSIKINSNIGKFLGDYRFKLSEDENYVFVEFMLK